MLLCELKWPDKTSVLKFLCSPFYGHFFRSQLVTRPGNVSFSPVCMGCNLPVCSRVKSWNSFPLSSNSETKLRVASVFKKNELKELRNTDLTNLTDEVRTWVLFWQETPAPFHMYMCVCLHLDICAPICLSIHLSEEEPGRLQSSRLKTWTRLSARAHTHTNIYDLSFYHGCCVNGKPPLTRDLMKPVLWGPQGNFRASQVWILHFSSDSLCLLPPGPHRLHQHAWLPLVCREFPDFLALSSILNIHPTPTHPCWNFYCLIKCNRAS